MARRNRIPWSALDNLAFACDIDAYHALERTARRVARTDPANAQQAAKNAAAALRNLRKRWRWPRELSLPITPAQEARAAPRPTVRTAARPAIIQRWTPRHDPMWLAVKAALQKERTKWTDAFLDRQTDSIVRAAKSVRQAQLNSEAVQAGAAGDRQRFERLRARWERRRSRAATKDAAGAADARRWLLSELKKLREEVAARRGRPGEWLPETEQQAQTLERLLAKHPYKFKGPARTRILLAARVVTRPYELRTLEHRSPAEHAVRRLRFR